MLTIIYAVAIASHILLDGMTSFGTRMWFPFSEQRVAWDILFIIDFTFTSLVLLPQIAAWIFKDREKATRRAVAMFLVFSVGAFGVWKIADAVGFPFHRWIAGVAILILAALFFVPLYRGAGFGITTPQWCRAGTYLTLVYLFSAPWRTTPLSRAPEPSPHRTTFQLNASPRSRCRLHCSIGAASFAHSTASTNRVSICVQTRPRNSGFAPIPRRMLSSPAPLQLPEVRTYWTFARFPVIRSFAAGGQHFVDFDENRFITRRTKGPAPFSYRVIFDNAGNPIEEGWQADSMDVQRMIKILPAHSGNSR